ncbi:MAG: L,D-transpeptidase [Symploca sp. SIO1B1]|nr:L,D-transpeptidase [Symploca sp. SIO1A3]NER92444.1 L,D-transpeptidase [Symploca sp. SIO1B1]
MIVCFGSAGLLLPQALQVTKEVPQTPKIATASRITPILNKALAGMGSQVVVDLSDAQVYLYGPERLLSSYPVAVGKAGWETPTGSFKVLNKQHNPVWKQPITGDLIPAGPDNPLGSRWISFWSDDKHQIGFHGTNNEQLVGQRVSHGCLRMRNTDIEKLYEQVRVGTPVTVQD